MATGRSLEDLPADLMLSVSYAYMLTLATTQTQEVLDARNKFERVFRDAAYEHDTGFPAIAQSIPPADGTVPPS